MSVESTVNQHGFWGETTAFLALFLDNVGVLIFFSAILVFTFNYPADIILTRMIPGTAVGVCIGDLVYTWLAIRLRRKTGRADVTAMPLGRHWLKGELMRYRANIFLLAIISIISALI
ncbi:MAG: hypothetical protein ABSF13_12380 [Smithella sp.]|jgi:AGZA family xanthine/uracil permease-like MFS transporter